MMEQMLRVCLLISCKSLRLYICAFSGVEYFCAEVCVHFFHMCTFFAGDGDALVAVPLSRLIVARVPDGIINPSTSRSMVNW